MADTAAALFAPAAKAASSLFAVFGMGILFGFFPRPLGLLNANAVRVFAAAVLNMLSPALLLSTFGRTLTPAALRDGGFAAGWAVVHIGVGIGVAFGARALAPPPRGLEGAFALSIVFANALSLPLLLLTSLTARGALRADPTALPRAIQFVFMYTIPWWLIMYSVGIELARVSSRGGGGGGGGGVVATLAGAFSRSLQPPIVAVFVGILIGLTPLSGLLFGPAAPFAGLGDVLTLFGQGSVPAANIVLAGSLYGGLADAVREARAALGEAAPPDDAPALTHLVSNARVLARAAAQTWRGGGGGGRGGRGGGAHVELRDADADGSASPAALVAPVAVLVSGGPASAAAAAGGPSPSPSPLPLPSPSPAAVTVADPAAATAAEAEVPLHLDARTTLTILVARLVVAPAISFGLFALAQRVPAFASDDAVLSLVVLVQAAMPSAQTALVVLSNVDDARAAKALSLLYIVMYPVACVALIPWLMLALKLTGKEVG